MPLRLVLLDRDGVLNRAAPGGAWITRPDEVKLLPGAAAGVRMLTRAQVPVAVVTNQRCIALGVAGPGEVDAVNAEVAMRLARSGGRVSSWYVCPHDVGLCDCRKPAPGLVLAALAAFGVAAADAVLVGDHRRDADAARAAGVRGVLLRPGERLDAVVRDLLDEPAQASGASRVTHP